MGVVYRARDPIINRLVALKTITTGVADDPDLLQRFYREAQSAGGLQHPNIITIYDMGQEGNVPFIAMELVEGENLEQVIARRAALPISLKLVYAMQACRAFDYAHKRGIVHRDIKPGNVMVSRDSTVKVVDFGIARVLEGSRTQTGMLIGTFAYMSPEQYHGEHADERSDIWSFGVLLYELLGYQRPFTGETPASLMHSICQQELKPLSRLLPDCPQELEIIVSKVLQKAPSERYQSMEDLLLELDPICRKLQAQSVAELVAQSRRHVEQSEFTEARDLLRQALQVESSNKQARALLEQVNAELKRILVRPKAQQYVEKGRMFLEERKIQEAKVAAESALQLDSGFAPAQELQRAVQQELDRAQLVAEWLEAAKQQMAEGLPDEAGVLVAKVLQTEPSNQQAINLQQQVVKEKAERQKRLRLLEGLQQARGLWTQQNYSECIRLLIDLGNEFPEEEEVPRLLETVREDHAEQQKQQALLDSRNLLAARRHQECLALLTDLRKRFPNDQEIPRLLEDVYKDQRNQRRLQGLAEARGLLSAERYSECTSLLAALQKEFPNESEIPRLTKAALDAQEEYRRQQGVAEARKLLAARRYEECMSLLMTLKKQFPTDDEIPKLLDAVREDQKEQRKQQGLAEARNLLASKNFEESLALLTSMQKEFPEEDEIRRLLDSAREEQAEQHKREGLAEARRLLASKNYDKFFALLTPLQKEFPEEDEIRRLLDSAREEQAEQHKREGLAQARTLLASRRYDESITLLSELQREFPGEVEINEQLETAREDRAEQHKQQQLADARARLAAQSFGEALALLDGLAQAHPNDAAVLKLRTLVRREQDKRARAERIQRELDALKKLMAEKKYPDVLSRTRELLTEFPGETNFKRLAEFAANQQANIENELLLRKTLEETKALFDANRFEEAIRAAQNGLRAFPGNRELVNLALEAEIQQRKLIIRQQIEQRIREIKVKINRERFSDAIDLAKQTLVTLGPDTDLTQLLNSAQVEFDARERQREQERKIETIRTLIESGNLEAAGRTIDEALETKVLETFDPRIQRLSEQIKDAKSVAARASAPGPSSVPPSISREYAFLQGPPLPTAPPPEKTPAADAPTQLASVSQPTFAPQPAAPAIPLKVEFPPSSGVQAPPKVGAGGANQSSIPPSPLAHRIEIPERPTPRSPSATVDVQTAPTPILRRPAIMVALALGMIMAGWFGLHSILSKLRPVSVSSTKPSATPEAPHIDPLEVQQREALNAADKLIAANDLDGARQKLQQAAALNGPLTSDLRRKISAIEESMKDANLRQLRRSEEVLWQNAMKSLAGARYPEAQKELHQILTLPSGGVRRQDAQNYLDKVIPQRILQNNLLAKARQNLKEGDFRSARQAADQIKQSGSDPTQLVAEIDQSEQSRLAQLESQFNQLKQRDDDEAIQQLRALLPKFQALASDGGPQSGEASSYANSIPGAMSEIQGRVQRRTADAAFQQMVQRYQQAASASDKNGLAAARNEFLSIVQSGGPHADDAQKYLADANSRLAGLNQPAIPPAKPPVKPETSSVVTVDEASAVRTAIQRYSQAFEQRDANALRKIWPNMGDNRYSGYRASFESASSIRMRINIEGVDLGPDGATAVVKAQVSLEYTPKGAKRNSRTDAEVFRLAKSNGAWIITDVQ
jgi:eukaryotic-like serine/threonine-protein kinase